jgi:hypothetical protein
MECIKEATEIELHHSNMKTGEGFSLSKSLSLSNPEGMKEGHL